MSRSADAIINPELLVWGRETIGYDLENAAKKIGVKPERLADWEEGERRPTVKQLFKVANVYKRPFAAFYFSSPPTHWDEPYDKLEDWRTLTKAQSSKKSPGLVLELREAARRREILLDLSDEMGEEIQEFNLVRQSGEPPAALANRVRKILGKSVEDQKSCKTQADALRMWRQAVESLGVLVFQTGIFGGHYPVDSTEMGGVAFYFEYLPIIIINSRDSSAGRVFTVMHELGHLALRQSGLSNFSEFEDLASDEVFCNEFAGELLVPTSALLSDPAVRDHHRMDWDDYDISRLANVFKVSREVILRRLLKNRRTTISNSKDMLVKQKEESELKNSSLRSLNRGGPAYHMKFVRCHGASFVSTVFEAYDKNIIHAGELSEYLGVKLKHLDNIRSDLAKVLS